MTVPLMATMGLTGLSGVCFSGLVRGSMGRTAFMATLTIAMILATDTMDRYRLAVASSSTTSKATKPEMDRVTRAPPVTMQVRNTHSPDIMAAEIMAAIPVVEMAAGIRVVAAAVAIPVAEILAVAVEPITRAT
jgi:hypothetical protein